MNARLVRLAPLALLCACASTRAPAPEAAPAPAPPAALYAYRLSVASVPPGAASLEVRLRLVDGSGELRPLSARGLVGNAAFERSLAAPFAQQEPAAALAWSQGQENGHAFHELVVGTRGRPLELELCLERAALTPDELQALEQELELGTSVEADGRPLPVTPTLLTTNLVRLR